MRIFLRKISGLICKEKPQTSIKNDNDFNLKDYKFLKSYLIGRKIIDVSYSKQTTGSELFEGIDYSNYFYTIFEFENGERINFTNESAGIWSKNINLHSVTHSNWNIDSKIEFKNLLLKNILKDDLGNLFFQLENDVIIYHSMDWGDELHFGEYSEFFDENEKSIWYD